ncbi:MAG: TetR/AcrR family transcriptional regulator [Hyphomonadaceae bacterium]
MTDQTDTTISPAERRRESVREMIVEAAEKLMAEEGEAGLSLRRVASEINYSPAAIYKYFKSKSELVDELKEGFFARILEKIECLQADDLPYREKARICIATYILTALEKPHHYSAAFSGVDETLGQMDWEAFLATNKGRAFFYLREVVAEGIETGALRSDLNAPLAAKSIWASCHGLAMLKAHMPGFPSMFLEGENMSGEAFVNYHADLMMRGLEVTERDTNSEGRANGPGVRAL